MQAGMSVVGFIFVAIMFDREEEQTPPTRVRFLRKILMRNRYRLL
jgi:hypothetical protein